MRLLFAFLFVSVASTAQAYCNRPSFYERMPDPPATNSKPGVPFCLNNYQWSRQHSCDEWTLRRYFDEVDEYIGDLQSYYRDVVAFANAAIDHADEALRFAHCEADEVAEQHE